MISIFRFETFFDYLLASLLFYRNTVVIVLFLHFLLLKLLLYLNLPQ